jgi:predicted ribosome quality control (RQC) complex YloA/Tae2 family protein
VSLGREELELTIGEAARRVEGGAIERVFDLGEDKVALELHARPERCWLLFSARPGFSRAHLLSERPPRAATPGPFVMLLRKHLAGARVERLAMAGDDRVVRLDALHRGERIALVAELTGRHANLFLLGADDRILGTLRANVSHRRELWPGQPYVYPLARPPAGGFPARFGGASPGRDAEALYEQLERDAQVAQVAAELARALREERKRLERRREAIARDRARAEDAARFRRYGELLLANLRDVARGQVVVRLTDYTIDPPAEVEVPLDPALAPRANADRHFQRYRKYREALSAIDGQLARAERDTRAIEGLEAKLVSAGGELAALDALRAELVARGLLRGTPPGISRCRLPAAEEPRQPFRRFVSREGKAILVGKGASDNDVLTFRVARGNDLWMHARDYPGSHVVVPLGRGEEPTQETLLDAATLAAHYSQAKGALVVDVAYTRRKNVTRPKGASSGRVAVSDAKTIPIRIEPARLERLLRKRDLGE